MTHNKNTGYDNEEREKGGKEEQRELYESHY